MNERIVQFRVGVMVLATLIISAILVLFFGEMPKLGNYTIHIRFHDAPGVTRHTPVRKSGIRIGRVMDIRFAEDDRSVIVTASIDANRRLYHNEVCQILSSLVMGDTALEFERSNLPSLPKTPIEDGETIDGMMAEDPGRAIASLQQGLSQTMRSVGGASRDMQMVLVRVDKLLEANEQRITKVIAQADDTLQILQKTLINSNEILGDAKVRNQFKQSMEQLPELLKDTRDTVKRMGDTIGSVEDNLHNLEGLTKPLGERGDTLVRRIDSSTAKLDRLMDELLSFTKDLNNPEGSLGKLVHDPEFYQHLNRAAKNVDELTRQLKPILDDARVFTDKIARHPESLGVRGAIQRNQGIK